MSGIRRPAVAREGWGREGSRAGFIGRGSDRKRLSHASCRWNCHWLQFTPPPRLRLLLLLLLLVALLTDTLHLTAARTCCTRTGHSADPPRALVDTVNDLLWHYASLDITTLGRADRSCIGNGLRCCRSNFDSSDCRALGPLLVDINRIGGVIVTTTVISRLIGVLCEIPVLTVSCLLGATAGDSVMRHRAVPPRSASRMTDVQKYLHVIYA